MGLTLVLVLLASPLSSANSQEGPGGWSKPELLLAGPVDETGTNPIVYTGRSGITHLLYFGHPESDSDGPIALYYARWAEGGWTPPIDVLVTPDNALPAYLVAMEDSTGFLYVIWNTNAVYFTRVNLTLTSHPNRWSTPAAIANNRLALEVVGAIDSNDNVAIAVATRDRTIEFVQVASTGALGQPVLIHQLDRSGQFPYHISLVVTQGGRLLACWAEVAAVGGRASGVWCSDSDDGGTVWSIPYAIATGHRGARVFSFLNKALLGRVIWGGAGVQGRDLQTSEDEGRSWSAPLNLTSGLSMNGYTGQVAAMDSLGDLNILVNPGDGKYVHVRVRKGAILSSVPTGWQASDWIEMAVAEGNTLVAVFWIGGSTYTTHLTLDAPKIVPSTFSQLRDPLPATPNRQMAPTDTPKPSNFPAPTVTATIQDPATLSGGTSSILLSIFPAVGLILGVALLKLWRQSA